MEADTALAGLGAAAVFPLPWPTRPPTPATAAKIQNDLRILTERLARINDNLARKISSRNEYDKTIQETEAAYAKVQPPCAAARLPPHRLSRTATRLAQRAAELALALPLRPLRGGGVACERLRLCSCVQITESHTYYDCTSYDRSWRARKRCCTCSSGRASTSRRRSRRLRRRLRFGTFLAGSLWR